MLLNDAFEELQSNLDTEIKNSIDVAFRRYVNLETAVPLDLSTARNWELFGSKPYCHVAHSHHVV